MTKPFAAGFCMLGYDVETCTYLPTTHCTMLVTFAPDEDYLLYIITIRLYKEFKMRNFNLEDSKKSGRPRMTVTKENVTDVRKILDKDKQVMYHQLKS